MIKIVRFYLQFKKPTEKNMEHTQNMDIDKEVRDKSKQLFKDYQKL